jgi:hypothetical protein
MVINGEKTKCAKRQCLVVDKGVGTNSKTSSMKTFMQDIKASLDSQLWVL